MDCLEGDDLRVTLLHLHNLPGHVQNAACCFAQEAAEAGGGAVPDHTSPYRLRFTIQHPPPLLSLLPLPQLQLPLLLVVAQPHQKLLLCTGAYVKKKSQGKCDLFQGMMEQSCLKVPVISNEFKKH